MNKARRKTLTKISVKLSELLKELEPLGNELSKCVDEESRCFENLPDSLKMSNKNLLLAEDLEDLKECSNDLEDALFNIGSIADHIQTIAQE